MKEFVKLGRELELVWNEAIHEVEHGFALSPRDDKERDVNVVNVGCKCSCLHDRRGLGVSRYDICSDQDSSHG